jgi:hypothetical protein
MTPLTVLTTPCFVPSPTTPASTAVSSSPTPATRAPFLRYVQVRRLQCRSSRSGHGSRGGDRRPTLVRHALPVEPAWKPITPTACGYNFVAASPLSTESAQSGKSLRTGEGFSCSAGGALATIPSERIHLSATSALTSTGGLVPAPIAPRLHPVTLLLVASCVPPDYSLAAPLPARYSPWTRSMLFLLRPRRHCLVFACLAVYRRTSSSALSSGASLLLRLLRSRFPLRCWHSVASTLRSSSPSSSSSC